MEQRPASNEFAHVCTSNPERLTLRFSDPLVTHEGNRKQNTSLTSFWKQRNWAYKIQTRNYTWLLWCHHCPAPQGGVVCSFGKVTYETLLSEFKVERSATALTAYLAHAMSCSIYIKIKKQLMGMLTRLKLDSLWRRSSICKCQWRQVLNHQEFGSICKQHSG